MGLEGSERQPNGRKSKRHDSGAKRKWAGGRANRRATNKEHKLGDGREIVSAQATIVDWGRLSTSRPAKMGKS